MQKALPDEIKRQGTKLNNVKEIKNPNNERVSTSIRVATNFFWLVVGEAISKGLTFLGVIYLARVLGATGFGLYSLAMAVGTYLWFISDLGISLYGAREVARHREKATELLQVLNSLRFIVTILSFLILAIVLQFLPIQATTIHVILAGGLYVVGYALSPDWLLRGIEKVQYIILGHVTIVGTFLVGIFLFVNQPRDAALAALLYSLAYFIGSGVLLLFLRKKLKIYFIMTLSWSRWKTHIKECWYFGILGVLSFFSTFIGIIMLGIFDSTESVGFFSAPHRIITLLLGFMGLFSLAFYPILTEHYAHDEEAFRNTHTIFQKIMLVVGIPLGIGGFILSEDIIQLFFGHEYTSSITVFRILICIIPLSFAGVTYRTALLATGLQRSYLQVTGMSVGIGVLLCLYLIPLYGLMGASLAMLAQELVLLIGTGWSFYQNLYKFIPVDRHLLKVLSASAIMGLMILNIETNVIERCLAGIIIYSLFVIFFRIITKEHVVRIYRALTHAI